MTRNQTDPMTAIDKQDTAERLKNRIFRHDPASIGNENRNRAAVLDATWQHSEAEELRPIYQTRVETNQPQAVRGRMQKHTL